MNGEALLRDWPTFDTADAETVFGSPAWRMKAGSPDAPAVLTKAREPVRDLLWLSVTLEDEAHVLGIGDSPSFPDLHLLWTRRENLPEAVRLVLVERECGELFRMLEKIFRRQLKVVGLVAGPSAGDGRRTDFRLVAGEVVFAFALDLSPALTAELGGRGRLDPGHEAIRALRRPAWTEYAAVALPEPEIAALSVGDRIVIPEGCKPSWRVTAPEDGLAHMRSEATGEVTFAQMADDDWPAPPEPGRIVLVRGGRPVARGTFGSLGLQRVFKVEEVMDHV